MIDKVQIGDATLYHGDCREYIYSFGMVDSIVTDPPYGMQFQSNRYRRDGRWSHGHDAIEGDDTAELMLWISEFPVRHSRYIFGRWENIPDVPAPKSVITWVKNNHSMGDLKHEHGRKTELVFFYPGPDHVWPDRRPVDVLEAARTGNKLHPTEKPVALMRKIVAWTDGVVLDPFMGSGSTGVACAQLGRKFIGIEKSRKYFDIACKRLEDECAQVDLFA